MPRNPTSPPGTHHPRPAARLKDRATALLPARRALPIWPHADAIREALARADVLVLAGETGSGKSTQVPQFLLAAPWCAARTVPSRRPDGARRAVAVGGGIAVTEPRRVAAVTLARRVAEETGTPLGTASPASTVGYAVRFDRATGPSTRVTFLTEGMLLQEMLADPALRKYSVVVVDEVHERGISVDLILGFLRKMLVEGGGEGRGGVPLKVVVMSATADVEGLRRYFEEGYAEAVQVDGGNKTEKQSDIEANHSDEGSEWSGIHSDEEAPSTSNGPETHQIGLQNGTRRHDTNEEADRNGSFSSNGTLSSERASSHSGARVSTLQIEGRQYPVKIIHSPDPVPDFVDAALHTIFRLHAAQPLPGDILVFLTGQETVESLLALVTEHAANLPPSLPKLLALPLFAALPPAQQQLVFSPAPTPRTRKVVLATNLAETAVTVPGVRHVIDGGKHKLRVFRPALGLDALLVRPIARAAAAQRAGRAGREAPGSCHRLYTAAAHVALPERDQPAILRGDLARAVLDLKARGVADVLAFPFPDAPPRAALAAALAQLLRLGALDPAHGAITPVGRALAALPLPAPLGRTLVAAAEPERDCLAETLDVVAALSGEQIFPAAASEDARERDAEARRGLLRREGDHLTLLAALRGFAAETGDRKDWARKHGCSHRALRAALDVRRQLRGMVSAKGAFAEGTDFEDVDDGRAVNAEKGEAVLKAVLAGFVGNTARLCPDGAYRMVGGGGQRSQGQTVAIHPSSVLFGRKVEAIVFGEWVFTNRSYARAVSAVRADWIAEALGAAE